ncbi:MAG: hypothetical protein Q3999_01740 [Buchananella hordeovulneris]|nr:hypothetical protein [Buchananella hordeovulneris]
MATLGLLIWLSGVPSARKSAKLSALEALRGGQADHSFSRNLLPLGVVRVSLPVLISLKELLASPGHALLILIVSAACSLGSVYALAGTGLLSDEEKALPLITGGILPQVVALDPSAQDLEQTIAAAKQLDGVQTAFYLNQGRLDSAAVGLFAVISDDFDQLPLNPLYEGRYPQHANEIVVGAPVAASAGLEVGSTWTLTQEGNSQQYLVTGLASSALNAGNFALMARDGYRQLVPGAKLTNIGIYTKPGVNPEGVKEAMQQVVGSDTQVVNSHRTLQVQVSSFLSMVPLLSYSLVVFAMVVVVLVIGLFTYSLVSRSLPSSGLLKALGFTSRQAASRVRWTVLPPLLVGVIGGGAAGAALISPLLALTLSGAGIKKVMVPIPLWPSYLVTGFVLVTALMVVYAATRPIARVSAQTLLAE